MSQPHPQPQPPLRAVDVLSVKSRVSWGAIAAGAMIAIAIYFVLTLLGIAVGLEMAFRRDSTSLGLAAAIWSIATLLFAMFIGGWSTSRLAVGETRGEAFLYGIILWGVMFVGMTWMIGQGVRVGFGAMLGVASGAVVMTDDDPATAATNGAIPALIQRYNSDLGGDKFVDDLTKTGVAKDQAVKIRDMVRDKINTIQNDSSPIGAVANDPQVRQSAEQLGDATRQAVWYTLIGVLVSMAAVIVGALAGSGELVVPVALAGVRKAPTTPRT